MTTETVAPPRAPQQALRPVVGLRALMFSAQVCLTVAAVLSVLAGTVGGGWWWASLSGSLIAVTVFLVGSAMVAVVAAIAPTASLLFALLTYLLEVVALAAVFAALSGLDTYAEGSARGWLAGSVIVVTLTWTTAHLTFAARQRIPVYDLGSDGSERSAG